jgi:serine/threonine-protein kinase
MAEEPVDPMRSLTLRQMTSRTRFEPRYSMRLWLQMLKALAELHRSGVYFGTITPDSISVDMTNTVAIVPAATPDPDYQAPEVAAGARPDEAADIYAMGCILYEMLTGSPEGKGVWPPSKIRDDVPDWLDFLVAKCLASDRTARYRSLDELSAAIVALKTGG